MQQQQQQSSEKSEKAIRSLSARELMEKTGLVSISLLVLAGCGIAILLLNVLGLVQPGSLFIPEVDDPRPLLISILGLVVLGLTPLMIRLVYDDFGR